MSKIIPAFVIHEIIPPVTINHCVEHISGRGEQYRNGVVCRICKPGGRTIPKDNWFHGFPDFCPLDDAEEGDNEVS